MLIFCYTKYMQFPRENSLESHIFNLLQHGPQEPTKLLEQIRSIRPSTTKQGLYAVLRNLKKQEILVVHNKQAEFNIRWLNHMQDFFSIAQSFYTKGSSGVGNFLNLKEGEKITYSFSTPVQTDAFWWHALYILSESSKTNEPVYLYNPHEWFLIARRQSELESIKLISSKKQFLLTAGGKTSLDKYVAGDFDGEKSQYFMADKFLFPKNSYYLNIVDDFLIEVWIDKNTALKIEKLYLAATGFNKEVEQQLKEIVSLKGKTKLTISRSSKKAAKLKKLFKKHFYIKH